MSAEVSKHRLVGFLSCFYLLMLRGVDLIDIVGWKIFYILHIFLLLSQSFLGTQGQLTFLEDAKIPTPRFHFFCHRLNIDRCMIKASDHDMLDFTPELKQTCHDLMTDSERYVVKLINLCVLNK